MACRIEVASSWSEKSSSIMAAERMVAIGLAMSLPVACG